MRELSNRAAKQTRQTDASLHVSSSVCVGGHLLVVVIAAEAYVGREVCGLWGSLDTGFGVRLNPWEGTVRRRI